MHMRPVPLLVATSFAVSIPSGPVRAVPTTSIEVVARRLVIDAPSSPLTAGQLRVNPASLAVAPDGSAVAYEGDDGKARRVYINGVAGPVLQESAEWQWLDDSSALVYLGKSGNSWRIYRNNKPDESTAAGLPEMAGLAASTRKGLNGPLPAALAWGAKGPTGWGLSKAGVPAGPATYSTVFLNRLQPGGNTLYSIVTNTLTNTEPGFWLAKDGELVGRTPVWDQTPMAPLWSPNGRHVAFGIKVGDKDVLALDEAGVTTLRGRPNLSWSPDGTRLAAWGAEVPFVTFKVPSQGPGVIEFNSGGPIFGQPVWSPDSAHFAYMRPDTGQIIQDGKVFAQAVTFDNTGRDLTGAGAAWERELRETRLAYSPQNRLAYTVAKNINGHLKQRVVVDGLMGPIQQNVYALRWDDEGNLPLYLSRDVLAGMPVWKIRCGKRETTLWTTSSGQYSAPLSQIISLGKRKYRVFGLNGSEVLRCDVSF